MKMITAFRIAQKSLEENLGLSAEEAKKRIRGQIYWMQWEKRKTRLSR